MQETTPQPKKSGKGKLYLIPSFLGEDNNAIIPDQVRNTVYALNHFIVENAKTARRYLRAIGFKKNFDTEVTIHELDKHGTNSSKQMLSAILAGHDMGIISEAGNPCIADPGFEIVSYAHSQNMQVVPLVGPSSILLALVASGMNGQQFSFHGYLPIQSIDRIKKLRQLEDSAKRNQGTQIFMETPFRNESLMKDAFQHLSGDTKLCIACDLTLPTEYIATKKVSDWQKQMPELHKRYCIFLIG
ncbi:MAG: putative methyltransferase [Bacteroidetes bacterium]|nr:putative methyltransferase [Bacteroidota bacterium]